METTIAFTLAAFTALVLMTALTITVYELRRVYRSHKNRDRRIA